MCRKENEMTTEPKNNEAAEQIDINPKYGFRIVTAKTAGFCFGVTNAVDTAIREAGKGGKLVTYGPIIHNENVVEDLRKKGVGIINTPEEIPAASDGTIIIRSHGVPKAIYEAMEKSGAHVVDATCPFVQRIHRIVEDASAKGEKIVIIGNHGHAEVEGTTGWSSTPVTVIETQEEAEAFEEDRSVPLCVVSQTTFNEAKFKDLVATLKRKGYNTNVNETICYATHERQSEARRIAKQADIMIVVGGKGSSNTAKLYEICRAECERTYFVQTVDDLKLSLTGSEKLIGITAGASTPKNIIEEVQNRVRGTDF
ncbi:MAG: 4-hydroxy-3-methylbut-2-enyl diphosphate reductase [Lachnospiraceae bacterium]|jgi:4-hydroxy-3-methylbut-2-enyl diphosphate reductase